VKAIPSIAAIAILVAQVSVCQDFKVGLPVADFSLRDLDGRSVSYSALKGKVTAVVFISTQCPVSNAYDDRMNALFKEFSGRVNFIFINSNATEQAGEVRDHARRVGFVFPVYKDPNNIVADRFGAESTPETYVMDASGVMRYHGYIDDSQNPSRVKNRGLALAIQSVLDGKTVEKPQTRAFGCTIKRARRAG
jgi:cytochrome oxidase Cu insertion factor (SCO1/SenC/PrrC family)